MSFVDQDELRRLAYQLVRWMDSKGLTMEEGKILLKYVIDVVSTGEIGVYVQKGFEDLEEMLLEKEGR